MGKETVDRYASFAMRTAERAVSGGFKGRGNEGFLEEI
jgi:hypothetical protein